MVPNKRQKSEESYEKKGCTFDFPIQTNEDDHARKQYGDLSDDDLDEMPKDGYHYIGSMNDQEMDFEVITRNELSNYLDKYTLKEPILVSKIVSALQEEWGQYR